MQQTLKQNIPTLLAVFVLILGLGVVLLVGQEDVDEQLVQPESAMQDFTFGCDEDAFAGAVERLFIRNVSDEANTEYSGYIQRVIDTNDSSSVSCLVVLLEHHSSLVANQAYVDYYDAYESVESNQIDSRLEGIAKDKSYYQAIRDSFVEKLQVVDLEFSVVRTQ